MMLLASYTKIRPGIQGVGNILINFRLSTIHSHSEVIFEPGDGVDYLMPDGTTQPNELGELWGASSVFSEKLPAFSPHRANKRGGVRFKRLKVDNGNWALLPINVQYAKQVATWYVVNQGRMYDFQLIFKYVIWIIRYTGPDRIMCSESLAEAMGFPEADRIDPALLYNLIKFMNGAYIPNLASLPEYTNNTLLLT